METCLYVSIGIFWKVCQLVSFVDIWVHCIRVLVRIGIKDVNIPNKIFERQCGIEALEISRFRIIGFIWNRLLQARFLHFL